MVERTIILNSLKNQLRFCLIKYIWGFSMISQKYKIYLMPEYIPFELEVNSVQLCREYNLLNIFKFRNTASYKNQILTVFI